MLTIQVSKSKGIKPLQPLYHCSWISTKHKSIDLANKAFSYKRIEEHKQECEEHNLKLQIYVKQI